jgi:RNA-binding protein
MDQCERSLSNADIRKLKAAAQRLKPILKIGKAGLTPAFLNSVHGALTAHELIKVKFDDFKDQKKTLAPELAEQTKSHLVTLIGNVAVLYRLKPATESSGSAPENS